MLKDPDFGGDAFVFTFMSFMMDWKSPPKALHSFSIAASMFLTSGKKSHQDALPSCEEKFAN